MAREKSDAFVETAIADIAKASVVLDVGGGKRFGKWLKRYEPLFKDCDYRTFDSDASTSPDVVGDIHAIPLPEASMDAVICSSVLQHVRDPLRAMEEMRRILKPGGKLFLYVPFVYPYHARGGHYSDYWRFSEDAVRELCSGFASVSVAKRGGYFLALSFFVPGQHRMRFFLTPLADALDVLFQTLRRTTTTGYYVYAIK